MTHHRCHIALVVLVSAILLTPSVMGQEHRTYALFDLDSTDTGPFPSDWFTEPDDAQNTGRHVSLPPPPDGCALSISECEDLAVINELDGFNLQPRLSIPFSGPIEPSTVTSDRVFLVSLGSTVPGQDLMPWGTKVGIDQVVWDTDTNMLHVESDALLAQHTRFALIVTRGIRDWNGFPVKATDEFRRFLTIDRADYKIALVEAMQAAWRHGVTPGDVVVASVFTTQSATAVMEKIRDQIHDATPDPADFLLGPSGERTVFALNQITGIAWRQQTLTDPPYFPPASVPLNLSLLNIFPGVVGSIAFGKYVSPDYEVHPVQYIPPVGTRSGTPAVQGTDDMYFNLFLPSGPTPSSGWPVVIVGHAVNGNKNVLPLSVASSMARYGIATIAINAVGHGFGWRGTLTVSETVGAPITFSAGGRGTDLNDDGRIEDSEGILTGRPRSAVALSDGFRQTAADLMQLARVIEVGMDVNGDGLSDLDPSRIYYLGSSLGGGYGTVFLAVEPHVQAGAVSAPFDPVPGTFLGIRRTAPGTILHARQPSLLNFPGITTIDGVSIPGPWFFDDNRPLRDQLPFTAGLEDSTTRIIQAPVTNTIVGAMETQAFAEHFEWVGQAGSPAAFAPHLRRSPLPGMTEKSVLFQIAKADQSATNPSTTAIVRAGDLADRVLYYRHDLAWLARFQYPFPTLPRNPHGFAVGLANFGDIAKGAQDQAARFFQSDGTEIIHPEPAQFFEFPIAGPLPENLNYDSITP